jgi:hypothetical protein
MRWGVQKTEHTWRKWFAWRPVRLTDGVWVWLETVELTSYLHWEVPSTAVFNRSLFGYFVCREVTGA